MIILQDICIVEMNTFDCNDDDEEGNKSINFIDVGNLSQKKGSCWELTAVRQLKNWPKKDQRTFGPVKLHTFRMICT